MTPRYNKKKQAGFLALSLCMLLSICGVFSTWMSVLFIDHIQFLNTRQAFFNAKAAALTGIRLAPQYLDTLPIRPKPINKQDFLTTPVYKFHNISFYYIRTQEALFCHGVSGSYTCSLRASFETHPEAAILSPVDFYFFED